MLPLDLNMACLSQPGEDRNGKMMGFAVARSRMRSRALHDGKTAKTKQRMGNPWFLVQAG